MKEELEDEMKICFVGGAKSIHVQRWTKWFAERGHEVHLITPSYAEIDGVKIHKIGGDKKGSITNFIKKMFQTRKLVRQIKPDILHAHYIFGYGTFGAFANYHPFVVSAWGSDVVRDFRKSILHKIVITFTLKKSDIIHVGDVYTKEKLVGMGIEERKFFVRPWGVDLKLFNPNEYSEELRKELNVDRYMILSANAWEPHYNVDILIRAAPYILKETNDVKFVLLGAGSIENELRDLTKKLGVKQNVTFVGRVPHREMPKYIASSDILVDTMATANEESGGGIGVTNMEAMACGVPVMMAEKTYLRREGKTLLDEEWYCNPMVCEPADPKDLGGKIIQLLKDEKMRKEIGRKEIEMAKKIGDWNKNMEIIESLMEERI